MSKLNKGKEEVNLLGSYKMHRKECKEDYKAEYSRMFPTKISSTNFLSLYTLYLLNKSSKSLYGKEMLEEVRSITKSAVWNPSHGTYYPLLSQMEKDGFIEHAKTVKSKKYYKITLLGKNELELKLEEFMPIMIGSLAFFSNILDEMYNN